MSVVTTREAIKHSLKHSRRAVLFEEQCHAGLQVVLLDASRHKITLAAMGIKASTEGIEGALRSLAVELHPNSPAAREIAAKPGEEPVPSPTSATPAAQALTEAPTPPEEPESGSGTDAGEGGYGARWGSRLYANESDEERRERLVDTVFEILIEDGIASGMKVACETSGDAMNDFAFRLLETVRDRRFEFPDKRKAVEEVLDATYAVAEELHPGSPGALRSALAVAGGGDAVRAGVAEFLCRNVAAYHTLQLAADRGYTHLHSLHTRSCPKGLSRDGQIAHLAAMEDVMVDGIPKSRCAAQIRLRRRARDAGGATDDVSLVYRAVARYEGLFERLELYARDRDGDSLLDASRWLHSAITKCLEVDVRAEYLSDFVHRAAVEVFDLPLVLADTNWLCGLVWLTQEHLDSLGLSDAIDRTHYDATGEEALEHLKRGERREIRNLYRQMIRDARTGSMPALPRTPEVEKRPRSPRRTLKRYCAQ